MFRRCFTEKFSISLLGISFRGLLVKFSDILDILVKNPPGILLGFLHPDVFIGIFQEVSQGILEKIVCEIVSEVSSVVLPKVPFVKSSGSSSSSAQFLQKLFHNLPQEFIQKFLQDISLHLVFIFSQNFPEFFFYTNVPSRMSQKFSREFINKFLGHSSRCFTVNLPSNFFECSS